MLQKRRRHIYFAGFILGFSLCFLIKKFLFDRKGYDFIDSEDVFEGEQRNEEVNFRLITAFSGNHFDEAL